MYQVVSWSTGFVVFSGTYSECRAWLSAESFVSGDISDFRVDRR